ncbi:MSC_0623 family F1-like ATPase-associated protein [Mycoplasmopsis verecunda]|uniref:Uncharacterized protein n=1 Tax=Mycoplasmopsis verecunda TaxID=171291 RepID=A0A1T4KM42_9BACT|nr:DUF2714 domain-containing protein [Mycoplasmopsis verecunda]WPB54293.1 DUF2714 domain-containing protein [Mycoplasmopsis verecunda]SJZ43476.1 Protein of unknown function [Mycoplasmopsis verecunda]
MKSNILCKIFHPNKNKSISNDQQAYFDVIAKDFYETKNSADFISYEAFTNQFLIINNISKNNAQWIELVGRRDAFVSNKDQIAYRDFTLSWTINPRFSLTNLVPTLNKNIDTNVNVLSWKISNDLATDKILNLYNDFLTKYLVLDKKAVEIIPNIIIKYNADLRVFNIFFNPGITNYANQEN